MQLHVLFYPILKCGNRGGRVHRVKLLSPDAMIASIVQQAKDYARANYC